MVRKFKGKWILLLVSALLLYAVPNFMIANEIPVDIFRGNHTYQLSGMDDITGMLIRLLMYLVSFVLVLTFLALIPDVKLPVTFFGRNTMGIYFFYYPIMIVLNGLLPRISTSIQDTPKSTQTFSICGMLRRSRLSVEE